LAPSLLHRVSQTSAAQGTPEVAKRMAGDAGTSPVKAVGALQKAGAV